MQGSLFEPAAAASSTTTRLAAGLDPANYVLAGQGFRGAASWKARILLGNSMPEDKSVGDFDEVGYVMVDAAGGEFIPVARSDEHNRGYDLVRYLLRRKIITGPARRFHSVHSARNLVFQTPDPAMQAALRAWLNAGGLDTPLFTWGSPGAAGFASDYVRGGFDAVRVDQPGPPPAIQRFCAALTRLDRVAVASERARRAGQDPDEPARLQAANDALAAATKIARAILWWTGFPAALRQAVEAAKAATPATVADAVRLAFDHDGLKGALHQTVREALRQPEGAYARTDLERELGRIEAIDTALRAISPGLDEHG